MRNVKPTTAELVTDLRELSNAISEDTCLITPEGVRMIQAAANELEGAEAQHKADVEDLEQRLRTIDLERADRVKAEEKLREIGEFFPVCGEIRCMDQHEHIQAILDKDNA